MSTAGQTITCSAFVAWEAGKDMVKETVKVAPPKAHEVRIKMTHTALCHTDVYTQSGSDPQGLFPVILGHEGAGIVESIGADVTSVAVGDHVVPLYIPECGKCEYCLSPKTNLCQAIVSTQYSGVMPDGTTRFTVEKDGKDVSLYHFMGISAFAEYTVVADISLCKINKDAPLSRACLLGCGVTTGHGAALNTAKVEKDSTCAVWGMGAVGLATIMGCKEAGAKKIVAVDINPSKEAIAREFGATDFFNPRAAQAIEDAKAEDDPTKRSAQQLILDVSGNNGFDYTFEAVGSIHTMRQALEAAHKGWGVSTIIGVAGAGQEISTRPFQLVTGRVWKGTAFGGYKSRSSVPGLVERYMAGTLEVDKFVSHELKFDQLNEAVELLHKGDGIRSVMEF